jgi:ferric-dicitrate binding protein FerR (iron transport regulator)
MYRRKEGNCGDGSALAAVHWLLKFKHDGSLTLSDKDLRDWASWSADPAHLQQFRLANRIWRNLSSALARDTPSAPG